MYSPILCGLYAKIRIVYVYTGQKCQRIPKDTIELVGSREIEQRKMEPENTLCRTSKHESQLKKKYQGQKPVQDAGICREEQRQLFYRQEPHGGKPNWVLGKATDC